MVPAMARPRLPTPPTLRPLVSGTRLSRFRRRILTHTAPPSSDETLTRMYQSQLSRHSANTPPVLTRLTERPTHPPLASATKWPVRAVWSPWPTATTSPHETCMAVKDPTTPTGSPHLTRITLRSLRAVHLADTHTTPHHAKVRSMALRSPTTAPRPKTCHDRCHHPRR